MFRSRARSCALLTLAATALLLLTTSTTEVQAQEEAPERAIAVLHGKEGSKVTGQVLFARQGEEIAVTAKVSGLEPGSKRGFHIHEFGDCSAADFSSAGGHFAGTGEEHGAPGEKNSHTGDLGNLEADESGEAMYSHRDKRLAFEGANSILGRAVIVHEQADDLESQPTGDAGGRVACGVIGIRQPLDKAETK